ncbi:pentatricopeptide repeat-containing protein At5g02830, chloroplastic isoform X2 [Phalaenopsis equestris]|uniref:pentatricopeptide repeat-containing protein At5g02830, chloroplastic isoform X2 n=1 Tax=Phalaenopsis equestris TaxID=78828 RepID=UPI0009E2B93C|nr:pentatricopeptide repeat-containing protein At5g02830, chloroplastic isoform X2 [Phalaenopsis equestris]
MAEVGVLTASSLLPPPSLALQRQKPLPPPWSHRADCRPLHTLHPSPVLLSVNHPGPSSTPTTSRLLKNYARLASKLALSGLFHEFLTIAESILASDAITAAESSRFIARIEANMVSRGIVAVIGDGRLDDAVDLLCRADKLGIRPLDLLDGSAIKAIKAECGRIMQRGCLEEYVRLMEILAGYGLFIKDISDPGDTIKFFVEKREPEMAVRYARLFPQFRLLVCRIIQEFGKKKDQFSARRTYKAFSKELDSADMHVCRSLIDVYGLCGAFLKTRQMFEGLLARNIIPNIFFFNSLMNVNSHDLSYAINVYNHMQILGVTADITSYNILLKACHNAKRVDLAEKIYKEAKQVASEGALKLDIITYSTMMKVFADTKMLEMAFKIKDEIIMAGIRVNVVTWSTLISACASATLVEEAVMMFEEMLGAGCEPNAYCYNSVLYACVESCQYDRAFRFFDTWKETGFEVINFDQGNKQVIAFRPTVATFNILMKACGTNHFRAKALISEMNVMGLSPNHISWSVLIDIYGSAYDMKGVMKALKAMRDTGIKLDVAAYTVAIKACAQNGKPSLAFSLFEEMKRDKLKPNLVTYKTLLRSRSQYGSLREVQQCLAVYQDMRKAGYNSNDYYLKELLEEWCEGILCSNSQKKNLNSTDERFSLNNSKKLSWPLLERMATFLQKDTDDYQAIDIRGLSKVEARIVVLSVLRMIKEDYQQGKNIQDDMIIILGTGDESTCSAGTEHEIKQAILQVLQGELGLHVITGHKPDLNISQAVKNPSNIAEDKYLQRRPHYSGLLKITKESLYQWLQGKEFTQIWFNRSFIFLGRHQSVSK